MCPELKKKTKVSPCSGEWTTCHRECKIRALPNFVYLLKLTIAINIFNDVMTCNESEPGIEQNKYLASSNIFFLKNYNKCEILLYQLTQ